MRRIVQQRGFTLIEMMVAVTIGLLIMVGVLSLYLNLRRTNDGMANTNALIENGRFAIQVLQEDLEHAGFWNGYVPPFDDLSFSDIPPAAGTFGGVPNVLPPACGSFSTWTLQQKAALVGVAVQTYPAPPSECSGIVTDQQPNTDIVVVRHVDTCVPGIGNCKTQGVLGDGSVYFQVSSCDSQSISPVPNPPPPAESPSSYVLDTNASVFTLHKLNCVTLAEVRKFVTNLYYVRSYAVTKGDGIPTLMRSQFDSGATQAAVPMVEGVEAFRIELGIDYLTRSGNTVSYTAYSNAIDWSDGTMAPPRNRGDGSPDSFIHCGTKASDDPCTVGTLVNVVGAKLYILVRSRATTPGYTSTKTFPSALGWTIPTGDGYQRHLFTSSATLINVSRRRQTP